MPGARVEIRVSSPYDADGIGCGTSRTYEVVADTTGYFRLGLFRAGDRRFGTTCRGTWGAVATDTFTGLPGNPVSWRVAWFPVHLQR